LNEIQTKQWLIDRFKHVLIVFGEGLEANKEKFEKYSEDHISDFKSKRNSILSGLASAAMCPRAKSEALSSAALRRLQYATSDHTDLGESELGLQVVVVED
jgi:hypothetical protein